MNSYSKKSRLVLGAWVPQLSERTCMEAALRCGDVGQHCVRGTLKLLESGQVLLLGLGPLLCLQGSLER